MPRFAHHRLEAYHAALDLATAGHRLARRMPRGHGDEPAAVLAQAGRTVALLTGLVRKFA